MAFVGFVHPSTTLSGAYRRRFLGAPRDSHKSPSSRRILPTMVVERRRRAPVGGLKFAVSLALSASLVGAGLANSIENPPAHASELTSAVKSTKARREASTNLVPVSVTTSFPDLSPNASPANATNSVSNQVTIRQEVDEVRFQDTIGHKSLGERIAEKLRAQGLPDELVVFILSAMPVVELRAGVPIGFVLGLHPAKVFALAVIGNIAPIIPVMFLLRIKAVQTLAAKVLDRARRKASSVGTSDSRAMALALFVGVPLPGTGAWTGCLVAFVLGMPIGQTLLSLFAGVVMAACLMTMLCAMGKVGAAFAGAVLLAVGVSSMLRVDSQRNANAMERDGQLLADGGPETS